MQYITGTVSVTNGSQTVTGSGTLWLANITIGDSFGVVSDNVTYDIASVDSDTQVTLSANYAGSTDSGLTYLIHRDFTADGIALLANGDIETGTIFTRAMNTIQDLLNTRNLASNGIYNGKMTISQRGDYTSATAMVTATYYLDRWISDELTVEGTIQDLGGSVKYLATVSSTGVGILGAHQRVESFADYATKGVTVSAKVTSNSSEARLIVWDGVNITTLDSHTGGGEEELLKGSVTVAVAADKLRIYVILSSASLGTVPILVNDYIEFTDVRLDLGSYRLSGDREYGEELVLCQRYYRPLAHLDIYMSISTGQAYVTTGAVYPIDIPTMRTTPTLVISDVSHFATGNASLADLTCTALSLGAADSSENSVRLLSTVASGLVAGNASTLRAISSSAILALQAEL